MGASQCAQVTYGPCDATISGSSLHYQENETLAALQVALNAFEEQGPEQGPQETAPTTITASQRKAIDAEVDVWMRTLIRGRGSPLIVDGAESFIAIRLQDPAVLILRTKVNDLSEELALSALAGVAVKVADRGCAQASCSGRGIVNGCSKSANTECKLVFNLADNMLRTLQIGFQDAVPAAAFGLSIRLMQAIGPAARPSKSSNKANSGNAAPEKIPKLSSIKRLASGELSSRLSSARGGGHNSSRSDTSASKHANVSLSARSSGQNRISSKSPSKDSKGETQSEPGTASARSTSQVRTLLQQQQRKATKKRGPPALMDPKAAEESIVQSLNSSEPSGPEEVGTGRDVFMSESPSHANAGGLMPAWYHAALGESPNAAAATPPTGAVLAQEPPHAKAVHAFLQGCSLDQYYDVFVANGFDRMEALSEIREDDLKSLGIPLGHSLLLLRNLRSAVKLSNGEAESDVFDSLELAHIRGQREATLKRVLRHAIEDED